MDKVDNSLIGAAGVYFIASELSRRGLVAMPTIRNTPGVDIIATSVDGTWHANLQVKTSGKRVEFWPVGSKYTGWRSATCFYCFARFLKNDSRFEVFLESSDRVAEQLDIYVVRERELEHAEFTPCWYLPKNVDDVARLRRQWLEFGPEQS